MAKKLTKAQRPKKAPLARTAKPPKALTKARTAAAQANVTTQLFERIATILQGARARVVRAVNHEMVLAYWQVGRALVEHLQGGDARAGYGKGFIDELSEKLRAHFGAGFSSTNLRYFRTFFLAYQDRTPRIREIEDERASVLPASGRRGAKGAIRHLGGGESGIPPQTQLEGFSSLLGWRHYRALMKVEDPAARRFYEIEAEQAGWTAEHLERQIHTQLFARLHKSRDKVGVLDLASRGQVLERPIDAIKHPYVLDFLDLPEGHTLREQDLETAILDQLQQFLLELGKGFAFVARQKRITFEDEHFYIDLVFYNIVLRCHLLIDLKLGKLTHQDVGQMDSYVRLFDHQCRNEGDNPTIGLILCAEKNEAIARYSILHGHEQLFAAKYVTYLPSEEELQREVARETRRIERSGSSAARRSRTRKA
jgi:predicted nuclease of restriction endonuclease-like (RecB) superfamily